MSVNETAKRAINDALSNVEDNLYRYKHFAKPDEVTGNGENVSDVIAKLEKQRDELRAALDNA